MEEAKEEVKPESAAEEKPEEVPETAPAEEVKPEEAPAAEKPEEDLEAATAEDEDYPENEDDDDAIQDEYSEDEEEEPDADEKAKSTEKQLAKKYRQLQVVHGKVVEVIEAQPERKIGNRVLKAKEERVLIELEDGQQGFLFRKDTADIASQDFRLFIQGAISPASSRRFIGREVHFSTVCQDAAILQVRK